MYGVVVDVGLCVRVDVVVVDVCCDLMVVVGCWIGCVEDFDFECCC